MAKPVYLDYNATTPIDPEVINEMLPYFQTGFGNPSSSYSIGSENLEAVNRARKKVADLINARPEEITFTSGGTESNNHAILGTANAHQGKGKHLITSEIEHPAVTNVCRHLAAQGWEITWLPVDKAGRVNPKYLESSIRPDTVLVSIMHANNEVGTIQPIKEISEVCRHFNVLLHTDAAQSIGKLETDVQALGVDLLTIAGHKLYAPKGIGALYVKDGVDIENLMFGAGQEEGVRPGTENVAYIAALGKACEISANNFDKNYQHMYDMREKLLEGLLLNIKNIRVNTDLSNSLPNTLSIAFDNVDAHKLTTLISNEVLISTGSACHSGITEISPVLKAMKIDLLTATGTVRVSTGRHTTKEEIEFAIEAISRAVQKLS